MSKLNLKVMTPEKQIYSDTVDEVVINTSLGEVGILPNHTSFVSKVVPGELRIKKDNKELSLAVGQGLLQVFDNTLSVLTDLAEHPEEIDLKEVEEAKKRAEQALEQKLDAEEYASTVAILEKSLAQLKVKRRHPKT